MQGSGGLWKTDVLQVKGEADDSDLVAHAADRQQICADMAGSFQVRYTTALSDPRIVAFRVFEHRLWPAYEQGQLNGGPDLYNYGIKQISYLIDNYSTFFQRDEAVQCLTQWTRLKVLIMRDGVLSALKFDQLWPRILTGFREFNIVGRLIAIMVILPMDTSGCERLFSLMNRIMCKWQTRMKPETLRNQMIWYEANRLLNPADWRLAVAMISSKWLKAGSTKSGKRLFRRDKLHQAGWVAAVEASIADLQAIQIGSDTYESVLAADIN